MSERTERVECLGLRCPTPILQTAKAARALGAEGGVIEVLADDAAFPIDLKSWCKSVNAELLSLEDSGGRFVAKVRVLRKAGAVTPNDAVASAAAPSGTPLNPPIAALAPAPSGTSSPFDAKVLDFRGRRCPEPIVELAKAARTAKGPLEVLADDPAFPLDLKSWCKSSGATMETLPSSDPQLHRVIVLPKGISRDMIAATVAAPGPTPTPIAAPPAITTRAEALDTRDVTTAVPPASNIGARFDLRTLATEALDEELQQIGRLRVGTAVSLCVAPVARQRVIRWCADGCHELLSYSGGDQFDVVLGRPAAPPTSSSTEIVPVAVDENYDCAILVMHNELETLLCALLMATTAAASGMRTMIFFSFWGINLLRSDTLNRAEPSEPVGFMQRMFKWMMPKGPRRQALGQLNFGGAGAAIMQGIMRDKRIADLQSMIDSAQEQQVAFVACTMSMAVMGVTRPEIHPYATLQYGGAATFMAASRTAKVSLVF